MKTYRILLADDHVLIRTGLREALTGIENLEIVGEVGNGRELAISLKISRPDLLVMDVNMPDFEPVEAVQRMRKNYPEMKILVVSAYDDQSYVVGLLSAGVNGYHLKDQPLSDLLLAVQRVLDGGRWISDPLVNRLIIHQTSLPDNPAPSLTRRQRELLYLLTLGYNNHKIARAMELSVKTVENHLTALYRALGVESRLEANNFANHHPDLLSIPGAEKTLPKNELQAEDQLTVLLVDDNPRYRAQMGRMLKKTHPNSSLFEAEDSTEALRMARQVCPKLAFVDVVLRDDDGIRCVRKLKQISPDTRIILISAYPDREFRRIGLEAGAIAFLDKKDLDAATFRQVIDDTLEINC
jgi:DNA-binding NarL/FixJ family response regulator